MQGSASCCRLHPDFKRLKADLSSALVVVNASRSPALGADEAKLQAVAAQLGSALRALLTTYAVPVQRSRYTAEEGNVLNALTVANCLPGSLLEVGQPALAGRQLGTRPLVHLRETIRAASQAVRFTLLVLSLKSCGS